MADPDAEFLKNPKFRAFQDEMVKELVSFDRVKEWADIIKCLKRVQKVLAKYAQFPIIPAKLVFWKRMAQCLNPELPPGVHLQTLVACQKVFDRIGPERLSSDLAIYSMGLFPLFQHAATQVKPVILSFYEQYYLPLGTSLGPCLSGLIMSILPGLEEESSEFYDRCLKLLDYISKKATKPLFFRALWKTILLSPHIRLPAINYLNTRLPADKSSEEVIDDYFPDRSSLVRNALTSALTDTELLVQRGAMELIINHFKLDEGLYRQEEWISLASAALLLITRREISLNRRLYAWFLGADESNREWFVQHGKAVVIGALRLLFAERERASTVQDATLPLRVVMALLNKAELGGEVIEPILVNIFQCFHATTKDQYPYSREVKHTILSLFEMLEPRIIWNSMAELFMEQLPKNEPMEALVLISDVIDLLPLDSVQTQQVHLPDLLCGLSNGAVVLANKGDFGELQSALHLAIKVYGKLASLAELHRDQAGQESGPQENAGFESAIAAFEEFFVAFATSHIIPHFSQDRVVAVAASNSYSLAPPPSIVLTGDDQERIRAYALACILLSNLERHLSPEQATPRGDPHEFPVWYNTLVECAQLPCPQLASESITVWSQVLRQPNAGIVGALRTYILQETTHPQLMIKILWNLLHGSLTSLHYRTAKVLLSLHTTCEHIVKNAITEELLHQDIQYRVEGCNRFALLWRLVNEMTTERVFSDNLLLMLDSLSDQQPVVRLSGRTWLAASITKVERILDPLLLVLLDPSTSRSWYVYRTTYDARRVLYILRILKAIIESDYRFIQHATTKTVSKDILALNEQQHVIEEEESGAFKAAGDDGDYRNAPSESLQIIVRNYVGLLALTAMRFVLGQAAPDADPEFVACNKVVQATSAEFLQYMLVRMTDRHRARAGYLARRIQQHVLQALAKSVTSSDLVLQVELLRLLRTVVMLQAWKPAISSTATPAAGAPGGPPAGSRSSTAGTSALPSAAIAAAVGGLSLSSPSDMHNQAATDADLLEEDDGKEPPRICSSPMFLQTLVSGILQPATTNVRYYWLEFITASMPYVQEDLAVLVGPLCSCLSDIMLTFDNAHDSTAINDAIVVLKSLNVVFSYCLLEEKVPVEEPTDQYGTSALSLIAMPIEMPVRFIAGFVKDVFVSEQPVAAQKTSPSVYARAELFKILPMTLRGLLKLWGSEERSDSTPDELHNKYTVQDHITHILDPIFAKFPTELLFSVCCLWEQDKGTSSNTLQTVLLQILSSLDSIRHEIVFQSLTTIVTNVLRERARISRRGTATGDTIASVPMHETTVLDFANHYLGASRPANRAASISSAWPSFHALVREVMASRSPTTFLLLLRTIDMYVEKLEKPALFEDKRALRELQEVSVRVVDLCVKISADINGSLVAENEPKDSPNNRMRSLSLKALSLTSSLIPTLYDTLFVDDKEKVNTALATLLPTVVNSFLKPSTNRQAPTQLAFAHSALRLFTGLLKHHNTFKVWRKEMTDLFYGSEFFQMDFNAIAEWTGIINYIMKVDKQAFPDLQRILSKSLQTHQASMMFVSKEQENLMRARNIKRLSFVLYSGEVDLYQSHLSWIQEKLVEALKLPDAYPVYVEVFHCLRILMLRISPRRLVSFWPVIFTELMRIFGYPNKTPTQAPLLLAACKFLDVALLASAEEFKLCEWMWVDDTPIAIPSNIPLFEPFMRRLCENIGPSITSLTLNYPLSPDGVARRPLIIERVIDKGDVLLPYLFNFSQLSYRSCTHGTRRDDEFLARVIEADMIEFKSIDHFDNSPKRLLEDEVRSKERPYQSPVVQPAVGDGDDEVGEEDFAVVADAAMPPMHVASSPNLSSNVVGLASASTSSIASTSSSASTSSNSLSSASEPVLLPGGSEIATDYAS